VLAIALSVGVTVRVQPVKAFPGIPCSGCAKDFAPGQLSKDSGGLPAKDFAAGQESKLITGPCSACNGASQFAPGQEKKHGGTTITGAINKIAGQFLFFLLLHNLSIYDVLESSLLLYNSSQSKMIIIL